MLLCVGVGTPLRGVKGTARGGKSLDKVVTVSKYLSLVYIVGG